MNLRRLLVLFLFPALALAQQPYYGTPASSIRLSAESDPSDLDRLAIHAGDILTPDTVRAAIQALFDTGRYRSVEVDAIATGSGTELTFNVTPHYFFSTFKLEPETLLNRPLASMLRLPVGQKYSDSRLEEVVEETKHLLTDAGYFELTLTTVPGPDNPQHLRSIEFRAARKERASIKEVSIKGGEREFTATELRNALGVAAGDAYNAEGVEKGVSEIRKDFLNQNYLNTRVEAKTDYDAASNSVRLAVTIDPGQRIVIDTGNKINEDEIRKLLPVFEEGALDPDLIREGRVRMVEYLQQQGFFEAEITGPEILNTEDGVRIKFTINTGDRHKLRSIRFQGNTIFTEEKLRERIKIRRAGFPEFLAHGLFTDQLLSADVTAIQNMYRRAGFEAAFVEGRRTDAPNHEIDVVFDIIENNRFPIENVTFTGNSELSETELRSAIKLKEGDLYSPLSAEDARTTLTILYYEMGFPDVRIEVTSDRNPLTNGRKLTYQIVEGPRYRVGEILVVGNTRTAEKVIKRASGLQEYEWFDPENVLEAQQRLYATGLFSHVDVVPLDEPTGPVRKILIQIEEGKTILVIPGVGVKERAGPRAILDVTHSNLLGLNRALTLRFRVGVHEQQFQTSYREPRLFNHDDLDGFGTLTAERTDEFSFEASRLEFALQARKRLSRTNSFLTTASYQTVNLRTLKLSPVVRKASDATGVIHIAQFGASFIGDRRDDILDPKRGHLSTSAFDIAGRAWGSEVNFVSLSNQSSFYRKKGIGTVALASHVGWKLPYGIDNELPITERFFAGGSTTLRGFELDEAGPPRGGQLLTIGNVEYRVPLKAFSIGTLGAAAFYDTGNVFERPADFAIGKFTHSAGFGLRFQTPLGPIRFDVGFNLRPRSRVRATDGVTVREGVVHRFLTLGNPF